jgi:alpha-L-fucosidase
LGDFGTPEQFVPETGLRDVDWESCITMNRNWGFNSHDGDFKSVAQLVGLLVETASKGGNLLLNVGPKADGTFLEASVDRLQGLARWMAVNGGAIHGSAASPFSGMPFRVTTQGNRLNLFLTDWPATVALPGLATPVGRAYLMADPGRTPLDVQPSAAGFTITLPPQSPDPTCAVVVVELDGPPRVRP